MQQLHPETPKPNTNLEPGHAYYSRPAAKWQGRSIMKKQKRDYKKYLEEYGRIIKNKGIGRMDYLEPVHILNECKGEILESISTALMVGWVMGYRAGLRQAKKEHK